MKDYAGTFGAKLISHTAPAMTAMLAVTMSQSVVSVMRGSEETSYIPASFPLIGYTGVTSANTDSSVKDGTVAAHHSHYQSQQANSIAGLWASFGNANCHYAGGSAAGLRKGASARGSNHENALRRIHCGDRPLRSEDGRSKEEANGNEAGGARGVLRGFLRVEFPICTRLFFCFHLTFL